MEITKLSDITILNALNKNYNTEFSTYKYNYDELLLNHIEKCINNKTLRRSDLEIYYNRIVDKNKIDLIEDNCNRSELFIDLKNLFIFLNSIENNNMHKKNYIIENLELYNKYEKLFKEEFDIDPIYKLKSLYRRNSRSLQSLYNIFVIYNILDYKEEIKYIYNNIDNYSSSISFDLLRTAISIKDKVEEDDYMDFINYLINSFIKSMYINKSSNSPNFLRNSCLYINKSEVIRISEIIDEYKDNHPDKEIIRLQKIFGEIIMNKSL